VISKKNKELKKILPKEAYANKTTKRKEICY